MGMWTSERRLAGQLQLRLELLEARLLLDVNSPFGDPVFTAVAGEPTVEAGSLGGEFDANGDAYTDLIITYDDGGDPPAAAFVRAMLGQPGGTFQEAVVANLQGPIRNIELADVDNDGRLDVVSHFETYYEGLIDVSFNDTDGTFSHQIPRIHIALNSRIDVLDMNGDGNMDILVFNAADTSVDVYLGTATAVFGSAVNTDFGTGKAIAHYTSDLNGDDVLDVILSYSVGTPVPTDNVVEVHLGQADGSFNTTAAWQDAGQWTNYGVLHELSGDGYLDMIGYRRDAMQPLGPASIVVFRNDGDGTFTTAYSKALNDGYSMLPSVVDLDKDGFNDLVIMDGYPSPLGASVTLRVVHNNGNATFSNVQQLVVHDLTIATASNGFDIDNDGWPDLAAQRAQYSGSDLTECEVDLYFNNGSGTFITTPAQVWPSELPTIPMGMPWDINGDSLWDVVFYRQLRDQDDYVTDDEVYVFMNTDGRAFGAEQMTEFGANTTVDMVLFDYDGDGNADVLPYYDVQPTSSDTAAGFTFWGGVGDGTFASASAPNTTSGRIRPGQLICDFEQDLDFDLIFIGIDPTGLHLVLNEGGAPADVPPQITLNEPAPETIVSAGSTFTITWTDSDPDDNAVIYLYWDNDTAWGNGTQGTDWDIITTSVWEDDANEYPWTVDAPAGGDYYFRAFIYDGTTSMDDYTSVPLHVNAEGSVTIVCVQREYHYNLPAPGDEDFGYRIEVEGDELTRLELTTPWGGAFDSADYVGPVWDGADYGYEVSGFEFDAYLEGGERHLDVAWWELSAGQWASLDTGDTDLTVSYTGGSWAATADFTGVPVPAEEPQITYPTHLETGVPLSPTIEWEPWTSPAPTAGVWLGLERTDTDEEVYGELLAADATSWTPPEALDPATDYTCALLFANYELPTLNGVDVEVVSYTESDILFTTLAVNPIWEEVAGHTYDDGVEVIILDMDPGNGVAPSDTVAWSWGEFVWGQTDIVVDAGYMGDRLINLIMLFGDGTNTADLGIEVSKNAGLASLIDARTNPQPLAFLASDGYVGTVSLGSGITGAVFNSGQPPLAIYSEDYVRTVIAKGDVDGNLLINGDLTLLQVLGGDLNGDVDLTGSNVGTVMALAIGGQGGDIAGRITTNGNVTTVMAIGGGISGSIQAPTGSVGTVMAIGGSITSPTIYAQTGVNLVQAVNGGVASSITSGASLGTVMAINGNLDVSGGRSISAGGTINALMAINGSILGDGLMSPDIYVGNGNLWSLQAVGGGMQSVWVDVNGAGASSGRLGSVYVGASVTRSRFEADGLLSSLFALGSFTNSSVQAGSLSVVYARGTISEDSTDADTDLIHADTGSYFVIDSTKFAQITSAVSDTFGSLIASVG